MRDEFVDHSRAVLEWCFANANSTLLAWHTITNAYYVLRKISGDQDARTFLSGYLEWMDVAPTNTALAVRGLDTIGGDFEDVLQGLCAEEAGADLIVTRNVNDFKGARVVAISPSEFLRLHSGQQI